MSTIPLAVYGTLRKAYGNHRIIEGAEFLGKHFVKHHQMWTSGAFPYAGYAPCSSITVEAYRVTPEQFKICDVLEGYPNHYQRKIVQLFENTNDKAPKGEAWMYYVTDEPMQSQLIESGDWEVYENEMAKVRKRRAKTVKTSANAYGYYEYDPLTGYQTWVSTHQRYKSPAKSKIFQNKKHQNQGV